MRVLYIWDADYPWDIRVEKICTTLVRHGHEVHIGARNLKRRPVVEKSEGFIIHRLNFYKNPTINETLSFPAFFSPIWKGFLDGLIRDNRIDLIIVRDLPLAVAGIRAGRRHAIPVIFDMAEDYVALIRDIWKVRKFQGFNLLVRNPFLAQYVEKYSLRCADRILVVIDEARNAIIQRGVDEKKISIVSNTPPKALFEQRGGLCDERIARIKGRFSMIYTGGIQMGRGIQIVLEAIPLIARSIPDFLFVIVGQGYATDQLKELICKQNVEDYVLWLGWVDHDKILGYIDACKIGIIPHLTSDHVNTTIPNKIFDYMGLGIPVIASDAVPMKRIIDGSQCGKTFKSGDSTDLAKIVVGMADSKFDYGGNGKKAVQERYNWEEDEKRLIETVNNVV